MSSDNATHNRESLWTIAVTFFVCCIGVAVVWAAWSLLPPLLSAWWQYVLLTLGAVVGFLVIAAAVVFLASAFSRLSEAVTDLRQGFQKATLELAERIASLDDTSRHRFDQIERQLQGLQRKTPPFLGALAVAAGLWQLIITKLMPEPGHALQEVAISAMLAMVFYWGSSALESEVRRDRVIGCVIVLVWAVVCFGLAGLLVAQTASASFWSSLTPLDVSCVAVTGLVAIVVPALSCTTWRKTK